jgi:hypothetical protein
MFHTLAEAIQILNAMPLRFVKLSATVSLHGILKHKPLNIQDLSHNNTCILSVCFAVHFL